MEINKADVAELVDARDLKSLDGNVEWVRVPPPAPSKNAFRATGPRRRNATRRRPQYLRHPAHARHRLAVAGRAPATETVPEPMWGIVVGPVVMLCPVLGHDSEKRV